MTKDEEIEKLKKHIALLESQMEPMVEALSNIEQTVMKQDDFTQGELYNECLNIASQALAHHAHLKKSLGERG